MNDGSRLLILGWSHFEGALDCLGKNQTLAELSTCVVQPTLPALVRTAMGRSSCVIVLHPDTPMEHELIEEFLLKVDRSNRVNSHYVIVVSRQGKRFKSGVQSHSVINTYDENAILRAVLHGIMVVSKSNAESGLAPASEVEPAQDGEAARLSHPSLMEYFKLPDFRKASPILASLVVDEREMLAVALTEIGRSGENGTGPCDPLTRAAMYLKKHRGIDVRVLSRSELARELWPPEGEGTLLPLPGLATYLGLAPTVRLRCSWVDEFKCWILNWGGNPKDGAFGQALIYTILRINRASRTKKTSEAA